MTWITIFRTTYLTFLGIPTFTIFNRLHGHPINEINEFINCFAVDDVIVHLKDKQKTIESQKQYILLKEPKTLKASATLRKELKKYTKDATSMIVAQRIGTIIHADKIVVLDEGECVGIGTHKELLKTCEVYKEIALSQLSEEELIIRESNDGQPMSFACVFEQMKNKIMHR